MEAGDRVSEKEPLRKSKRIADKNKEKLKPKVRIHEETRLFTKTFMTPQGVLHRVRYGVNEIRGIPIQECENLNSLEQPSQQPTTFLDNQELNTEGYNVQESIKRKESKNKQSQAHELVKLQQLSQRKRKTTENNISNVPMRRYVKNKVSQKCTTTKRKSTAKVRSAGAANNVSALPHALNTEQQYSANNIHEIGRLPGNAHKQCSGTMAHTMAPENPTVGTTFNNNPYLMTNPGNEQQFMGPECLVPTLGQNGQHFRNVPLSYPGGHMLQNRLFSNPSGNLVLPNEQQQTTTNMANRLFMGNKPFPNTMETNTTSFPNRLHNQFCSALPPDFWSQNFQASSNHQFPSTSSVNPPRIQVTTGSQTDIQLPVREACQFPRILFPRSFQQPDHPSVCNQQSQAQQPVMQSVSTQTTSEPTHSTVPDFQKRITNIMQKDEYTNTERSSGSEMLIGPSTHQAHNTDLGMQIPQLPHLFAFPMAQCSENQEAESENQHTFYLPFYDNYSPIQIETRQEPP